MPKPSRIVRVQPEVRPEYTHRIEIVEALRGEKFRVTGEFNVADIYDAKNSADRMQREFDEDGDPCRTYVYREGDPVPFYAGMQHLDPGSRYRGI